MKKIFRIFAIFMVLTMSVNSSFAISTSKIDKLINKSDINETSTLAISVKNVETGEVVYEKNSKKLLHPASVLKIFTTYSSLDTLTFDYQFTTQFYKDSDNNLYIKLGADPTLTSSQLRMAFSKLKSDDLKSFNNLYFDDSVIDKKEFSAGWMWDDDINPSTPKISSYNLDKNIIKVDFVKYDNGICIVEPDTNFPLTIVSAINANADSNQLFIDRYNWNNPEVVEITGSVSNMKNISVPLSSMRRYFIHTVEKALEDNNIEILQTQYSSKLVPENATLLYEIKNPILPVVSKALHDSDNLVTETIFKLAGAKKYNATGNELLAIKNFKEFCEKNKIDTDSIVIRDGSGVSRKNLVSVDWTTEALNKLSKEKNFKNFKEYMAQSGDGTLSKRLYDLRGDAFLKTGSLSGLSTIAGYVHSKDGKVYSVAIFVQNFLKAHKEVKELEDKIITLIYE